MLLIVYSLLTMALFVWAAAVPAHKAAQEREMIKFRDNMRAVELKYARLAYPTLQTLTSNEIDSRYGLEHAYRSIKMRRRPTH